MPHTIGFMDSIAEDCLILDGQPLSLAEIEAVSLTRRPVTVAPAALARGTLKAGASSFEAGRLGKVEIKGSDIILGAPLLFRKDNIDKFNF